jgi:ribosomal-protein-alanine N-acetyltransferase
MTPPPSARLTFRSWTKADYALAESLWCDEDVTHFFGGAMTPEETSEFAGCAGLRPWQFDANVMEAGVHLMRSAWGLRLGEEALRAVLAHGFETLQQPVIVAGHGVEHANSQKLLERVGFRYTHSAAWGLKQIEVRLYALDAERWRASQPIPSA